MNLASQRVERQYALINGVYGRISTIDSLRVRALLSSGETAELAVDNAPPDCGNGVKVPPTAPILEPQVSQSISVVPERMTRFTFSKEKISK